MHSSRKMKPKGKNQSTERDPEMIQMINLIEKDIKTAIISIFYMLKKVKNEHVKKKNDIF